MKHQPENKSLIEPAHVLVFASQAVTQELISAVQGVAAPVRVDAQDWTAPVETDSSPDLIIYEIQSSKQAADSCRELSARWPMATLISCALNHRNSNAALSQDAENLRAAALEAGYQEHLMVDEAALHLPFFLRYAEQRKLSDRRHEERALHLKRLLETSARLHASLDQQYVAGVVLDEFSTRIKANKWLLYMLSDDGQFLELVRAEGIKTRPQSLTLSVTGSGLIETTLRLRETIVSNHSGSVEPDQNHSDQLENDGPGGQANTSAGSAICLPLKIDGEVVGVTQAMRTSEHSIFDQSEQQTLTELVPMAASALRNAAQFARAERLYMQDDLTQLYNSRYLRQFLENEIRRAKRYGNPVALVFIDLDGFKQVNDTYGHRVGSETLREVAGLLATSVRETDVVARYGGDEFTIVLPETGAEKALITAERVRRRIAEWTFHGESKHSFHLTASFGIAAFPEHPVSSASDMLERLTWRCMKPRQLIKILSNWLSESELSCEILVCFPLKLTIHT
ncbi:MAG TPA: sensor domain-containing diguanylate cyclase [Blastocatellia bacterium]|nr:sensor domain-containing diguanylate cyclase [Blastocatellia bacterium]